MRPMSLATRLTLLFAIAAAIVFPVFGWIIIDAMENHFEEGDIAELRIIADTVYGALAGVQGPSDLESVEQRFDDILVGHHTASLYIEQAGGQLLYKSGHGPDLSALDLDLPESANGESIQLYTEQSETFRVLIRRIGGAASALPDAHTLVVATPIGYHLAFLAEFRSALWLMVASGVLIISAMGWVAVRRGHAPLREIVGRMQLVSGSEGAEVIPPHSVPSELSDLASSFNEMTRRVDESFRRLTHFNADIAHELRTPITNLMTQTQVSLSRARGVDEYREILYSNMEEYERMAQMVGDMLFLAQQDAGPNQREAESVNLAAELHRLFEYYDGWAEERGVSLELEGQACVSGDRRLLQRALGNLLSNAIRYTPSGELVRVRLKSADGKVTIEISNSGAPIHADDLPKIFDRFFRVDPSRQRSGEGAGLGLAIVKSIIEVHGGTVAVVSNDECTRFTLTLPAAE